MPGLASRLRACRRFPLPQVKNLYNLTLPYITSWYKYGTPEYDRETQELLDYGGQVSKRTAYQNDTAKFWLGKRVQLIGWLVRCRAQMPYCPCRLQFPPCSPKPCPKRRALAHMQA